MAKSNVTSKCSWTIGIIYAVVVAILAAVVVYVGLNNAMPYELGVYDRAGQAVTVLFTDDFFNSSQLLMLITPVFPVLAYLLMYGKYAHLVGEHPEEKERVKAGKYGKPWVMPLILMVVLLAVWGIVSGTMIALGLDLDITLFADKIMLRQYYLVYAIAFVVDIVLFMLGNQFFKPSEVQRA